MQVWRHLQKHLPGHWHEPSSFSPSSSLQIGGFVKQQTPTSIFYVPLDSDNDAGETLTSLSETKLNGRHCMMDASSDQVQLSRSLPNSTSSHTHRDSSPGSADVAKLAALKKSDRVKKLPPPMPPPPPPTQHHHHQQQQQQQLLADSAVSDKQKETGCLVMCLRGTLYPQGSAPLASDSAHKTTSSVTKPVPPVSSNFLSFSYHFPILSH